jgi:hypothetical protein
MAKYVFEHAAYMCFKAHVVNWTVLATVAHLEKASARDQELAHELRDYRFTWARQPAPNRLLRFHLDRDQEMPSLLCGAGSELDSSQLFSTHLAAARAASHAQAAQAAQPKLPEELNATCAAARRIERELRTQIAALEAELADAARRAEEHELSTRSAQE